MTGGGRGIGRAFSLALAKAGASIAICGRRRDTLDQVAAEMRELGARATLALVGDVSHEDDCRRIVDAVVEAFGGVQVLRTRDLF